MQKKMICMTLLLLVVFCGTALAASGQRVVFYPSGADFSSEVKANIKNDVNGNYVLFTLSGQAVPDTFTIASLSKGVAINDVSWSRSDLSRSPAAIELGKKIDQLKFKRNTVISQKQAIDGGIVFWKERGSEQQIKPADLNKIAGLVVSNLSNLYTESAKLKVKIDELQELINDLQRQLEEMSGGGKLVWNVKVSIVSKGAKSADFKIGYMLGNCGWTPKYKLDAFPGSGKVQFTFEAEIRQGSGMDFKNCDVALATVKKRSRISPPQLDIWIIEPRPEPEPVVGRYVMDEMNMAMESASMAKSAGSGVSYSPAPKRVSKATYSLWEMGKKSIPAGSTRKYAVESETWKSEFSFIARPSLTPDIFVSAKTLLAEAKDYPVGVALMFMEGTMIGKKRFSFSGKEKKLFFGSDPMLKAERKTVEKKSGEQGMFSSKQTYSWKYKLELENSRKSPIKVLVQEPAPISGDKRIKLEIITKPKAEIKDDNFEWLVEVPAAGKYSVNYAVEMKAPDDMEIDLGIGR
ncbi:mucoidy inhibitor MuiA family protein [Marinifilum sp. JC120]|nr:mucoidy inhibitor MuiA family protein [Marinifilum sp. JC120]